MQSGDYLTIITDVIGDGLVLLYFFKSKRCKYLLTEPFIVEPESKEFKLQRDYYQPKTWAF
ncbi:MAG: hypothetical protein Q4F54_00565 [Coriobacteriia bacterium]|nr:hypothetical protein [Coriobacteriia bacterium]